MIGTGGVVLLWFLPNNIMTAKRFTSEEKALLIARTQQNQTGVYNPTIKIPQIKEALLDPQCWILFFFTLLNETVNGGVANFGKLIVKGLSGGDALLTTAYGIPQGAWQVFFVFTGPYIASRFKNIRTIIMVSRLRKIFARYVLTLPRSYISSQRSSDSHFSGIWTMRSILRDYLCAITSSVRTSLV